MSETIQALFGNYIESHPDSSEQFNADTIIQKTLEADHGKHFAECIMSILGEALYIEKKNAFAAGMKAGMEICSFTQKGVTNE